MIEQYKFSVVGQMDAALEMFKTGLDMCSDSRWKEPVAKMTVNQVAFHTLFFTDLYLGKDIEEMKKQEFHLDNKQVFAEYEELKDKSQRAAYERDFVMQYLEFVKHKTKDIVSLETIESLNEPAGFSWLHFNRFELHFYNIRHVSYHVGQLGLLWQQEQNQGIQWVK